MIVQLRIDDDLIEEYKGEVSESTSLEMILADRLKRALVMIPNSRYIVLADRARDQMEQLVGGGSLRSADDLLLRVRRLANVKFGDHELDLTPGQMEEIAFRAKKMGKSVEAVVKETWDRFTQDFFSLVR